MMSRGNDFELAHYQSGGATSDDLQDAEREFLLVNVPGGLGTNPDLWYQFLVGNGGVGALQDMKVAYWNSLP